MFLYFWDFVFHQPNFLHCLILLQFFQFCIVKVCGLLMIFVFSPAINTSLQQTHHTFGEVKSSQHRKSQTNTKPPKRTSPLSISRMGEQFHHYFLFAHCEFYYAPPFAAKWHRFVTLPRRIADGAILCTDGQTAGTWGAAGWLKTQPMGL